jgi:hypothetical protein
MPLLKSSKKSNTAEPADAGAAAGLPCLMRIAAVPALGIFTHSFDSPAGFHDSIQ